MNEFPIFIRVYVNFSGARERQTGECASVSPRESATDPSVPCQVVTEPATQTSQIKQATRVRILMTPLCHLVGIKKNHDVKLIIPSKPCP